MVVLTKSARSSACSGQPEDVAAAVAFLATPAARQITGTILNVDGGALT